MESTWLNQDGRQWFVVQQSFCITNSKLSHPGPRSLPHSCHAMLLLRVTTLKTAGREILVPVVKLQGLVNINMKIENPSPTPPTKNVFLSLSIIMLYDPYNKNNKKVQTKMTV